MKSELPRSFTITDATLSKRTEDSSQLTKNFQIIVTLSRLVGCHPHPIFSENSLRTTRLAKLWSVVWIVVVTTMFGFALERLISCPFAFSNNIVSELVVLFGFGITALNSIARAGRYEKAIIKIQKFDAATGARTKHRIVENFITIDLLIFSWACIAWIFTTDIGNTDPKNMFYLFGICVLSLEVHKFCFILSSVLRRFVQLKRITSSGKIDIVSIDNDIYHQPLTVQDVFILYHSLADAVKNLNRYYDVLIVYWLAYFISEVIMQAYILVHETPENAIKPIARVAFSLYCPTLICGVSHFTCKRANELGQLLFGYKAPTLVTTVSSLESFEFGFWLFQQPLEITGLKLFYVNLPLLLSIIEASATYATFIFQSTLPTDGTLVEQKYINKTKI